MPQPGSPPYISFVVPARNEAGMLPDTLDAIHAAVSGRWPYEMIVVDNASSDSTAQVAAERGARVVFKDRGPIGAIRNEGVRHSRGRVLVFLDADVVVTEEWGERLPEALERVEREPATVTGGGCVVPADAGWLERTWFAPRDSAAFSHIGTGQMLLTRELFDAVGGFDETLESGEDYDLCQRVERVGGRLVPDPRLVAEHRGFPKTVTEFLRREAWHGRSDAASLGAIARSRVAQAALLFAALHVILVLAVLTSNPTMAAVSALAIVGICLLSSLRKYRGQSLRLVLVNAGIYYLYFVGRTGSFLVRGSTARRRA